MFHVKQLNYSICINNLSASSIISLSMSIITDLHFSNSSADDVIPILPLEVNLSVTLLFWLLVLVVSPVPVFVDCEVDWSVVIEVAKFSVVAKRVSGVSFTIFLLFAVLLLLLVVDDDVVADPLALPYVILSSTKSLFNKKLMFCLSTSNSVLNLSFHILKPLSR